MGREPGTPDSFCGSVMPPWTKDPSLSCSPSFTMTDRWISGAFGFWGGGQESVKKKPLSPFSGLVPGVVGEVEVLEVGRVGERLSMWSAGIYISSLDIDWGSVSA